MSELRKEGTTVLLTTQYLEEADQLADTLSVLDRGKVIASGTPDQLTMPCPPSRCRVGYRCTPTTAR